MVGILILSGSRRGSPGPSLRWSSGSSCRPPWICRPGVAVVGDVATGIAVPGLPRHPVRRLRLPHRRARSGIVFLALAESIGAARSFGAGHGYDIDPGPGAHRARRVQRRQRPVRRVRGRRQLQPVRDRRGGGRPDPAVVARSRPAWSSRRRSSSRRCSRTCRLSVLAAIVISSVLNLVNLGRAAPLPRLAPDRLPAGHDGLGGVVFTTALTGMAIAVALSLLAILYQASRPYIAVLGRIPGDPPVFADAGRHASADRSRGS